MSSFASRLKQVNKINKRTRDTVHGWIRKFEKELSIGHLPSVLRAICILYFHEYEIFNIIGQNVKLSNNKKCITTINAPSINGGWNTNYGIIKIPSMSDIIYEWKIKINKSKFASGNVICVGLSSSQSPNSGFNNDNGVHYVFGNGGQIYDMIPKNNNYWRDYAKNNFNENDIISIRLHLEQREIGFAINGVDQGVAYRNIKKSKDIHYRLMVAMFFKDDSVQVTEFLKR